MQEFGLEVGAGLREDEAGVLPGGGEVGLQGADHHVDLVFVFGVDALGGEQFGHALGQPLPLHLLHDIHRDQLAPHIFPHRLPIPLQLLAQPPHFPPLLLHHLFHALYDCLVRL